MDAHALLLNAPHDLEWRPQPLQKPARGEALIRTLYSAISIGTELPLYRGTSRNPLNVTYPLMTGYETYGVVEAVDEGVETVRVGERVVTFSGHVTRAVVPASKLIPIPHDLDPRLALLAILSNDAKKGVLKVTPQPGERALVTGAGAIGLLTLFTLQALGAEHIDVVELSEERLELARHLGAHNTFTPEEAKDMQTSYEVGMECSSRNAAFALLQDKLQPGGRICVLADGNLEPLELTPQFHQKELHVVGSSNGEDYRGHAAWFFGLSDLFTLTRLFDLEVSAADLPQTFEKLARGERPVKVLVRYGEVSQKV